MRNKILLFTLVVASLWSCIDEDFNTDEKNPEKVKGNTLFSNAEKDMADQINSTNVNYNVWKLWSQYWTETTYTDEANYDIVTRTIAGNTFFKYYIEFLKDLKEAAIIIGEEDAPLDKDILNQSNRLHIIEILNVFSYQRLVDIFGAVPYSDALDIENVYPKYDDGLTIYKDLLIRLDAAIDGLNANIVSAENLELDPSSFGTDDLIYSGDVASWVKFGNSLKIKLGITISDVDEASSIAKAAVEDGVKGCFESSSDDAKFPYLTSSPNFNPLYADIIAAGRDDFVPANTIVDIMASLKDPRMDSYFDNKISVTFPTDDNDTKQNDTIATDVSILFYYNNGIQELVEADSIFTAKDTVYGIVVEQADTILKPAYFKGGQYGESSPFASNSHIDANVSSASFPGFIMSYTEILFYLAEAAERGYTVPKTAEQYYNAGITSSFNDWEVGNAASDYLASPEVAYSTAEGDWRQKIGTQSWLASYGKGLVGYTTWRRLDYPVFNKPSSIVKNKEEIPVRFTFPINEQTLNSSNYDAASTAIGGDKLTTKIFWDKF